MSNIPTPPQPNDPYPAVRADPKKPWKAIASAALSFVGAAVAWWVADEDPFTAKDAGEAFLAGLAVAAPTGLGTYAARNPLVQGRHRR